MYFAEITLTHIPSVNQAHQIGRRKNKVWIYLNPNIKKMQDKIKLDLISQNCEDYFKKYRNSNKYCFNLSLTFILNTGFWTRDVSNLIKYVEDGIMAITKIDDSLTTIVNSKKLLDESSKYEKILIKIKPRLKTPRGNLK